jgi:hypothetical protein
MYIQTGITHREFNLNPKLLRHSEGISIFPPCYQYYFIMTVLYVEFCGGSKQTEHAWNGDLGLLHAGIYSYNPTFDIMKNLIERSHRSDDEEWLIPHGPSMGTKELFLHRASDYQYYWNFERVHSGIGMHGRTPFEVLQQSGITGAGALMEFPVLILDDCVLQLQRYIFTQLGILLKKDSFMQSPGECSSLLIQALNL